MNTKKSGEMRSPAISKSDRNVETNRLETYPTNTLKAAVFGKLENLKKVLDLFLKLSYNSKHRGYKDHDIFRLTYLDEKEESENA